MPKRFLILPLFTNARNKQTKHFHFGYELGITVLITTPRIVVRSGLPMTVLLTPLLIAKINVFILLLMTYKANV